MISLEMLLILLLMIACTEAQDTTTTVVHVFPSCSHQLNVESCMEIDQALAELNSGMTLYLLEGTHTVRKVHYRENEGLSDISLQGIGAEMTKITCVDKIGLAFTNITDLLLANITISGCGLTGEALNDFVTLVIEKVNLWFTIHDTTIIGLALGDCENVTIMDAHITRTTGLGLLGVNVVGKSELIRVNFTENVRPHCVRNGLEPILPSFITPETFDQVGGGAYFLYTDYHNSTRGKIKGCHNNTDENSNDENDVTLVLTESYFTKNADCSFVAYTNLNFPYFSSGGNSLYEYTVGAGGGLSVVLANSNYGVEVNVNDTVFHKNDARYGGGAYVAGFSGLQSSIRVEFSGCTFSENGIASIGDNDAFNQSYCNGGAGLAIFKDLLRPENFETGVLSPTGNAEVKVTDTEFVGNQAAVQGGGVFAYSLFNSPHRTSDISNKTNFFNVQWFFFNTNFTDNFAHRGAAVFLTQLVSFGSNGNVLTGFENTNFRQNGRQTSESNLREDTSIVHLQSVVCFILEGETVFSDNLGSALYIESSIVILKSNARAVFEGNQANRGGGVFFADYSPAIRMDSNSSLLFKDNRAFLQGGAIYFDSLGFSSELLQPLNFRDCFIRTPGFVGSENDNFLGIFDLGIAIKFENNAAPLGSILFGSSLESCPWARNIISPNAAAGSDPLSLLEILDQEFDSTFVFNVDGGDETFASSPPASISVTLCDNNTILELFPGQVAYINIKVYDVFNNRIPAVVTSSVEEDVNAKVTSILGDSGFWYTGIDDDLAPLRFEGDYSVMFSVSIFTDKNTTGTTISVNLSPCPIGFSLVNQTCTCSDQLQNREGLECSQDSVSLTTFNGYWIGVTDPTANNLTTEDLVLHTCAFTYCNQKNTTIELARMNFDDQCNADHSGFLCGGCIEGHSVVFGTVECFPCKDFWLFTIPLFAIGGAVFFAVIALLEVTVDKGITNAIGFFLNIVSVYEFLRPQGIGFDILNLPVNLLSLQLGIRVCFYEGMTALTRTFIQLLFPLYLFILMAIFACLCHWFSWFSTNFSPIKTLVTLMIVCYLRTLTTCLEIVAPSTVSFNSDVSARWHIDPNVEYFRDLHVLLCIIGIIIILLYIIPVPIFLLFPSVAYKYASKYTPFLDALWTAYKPKFRFMLGLRLIVVLALQLTTYFPQTYGFAVSAGIIVVFSKIQSLIGPFKDKWANYADGFFTTIVTLFYLGNLVLFTADQVSRVRIVTDIGVYILTLSSYTVILMLLILHIFRQFPQLKVKVLRMMGRIKAKLWRADMKAEVSLENAHQRFPLVNNVSTTSLSLVECEPYHKVHQSAPPTLERSSQFRESIFAA